MQSTLNTIIQNYFSRDSLEMVTEAELEAYIQKYPYTSIGHFLLAKKKKMEGQDYQAPAARAVLYVNNPLWFEYLFNESQAISQPSLPEEFTSAAPASSITPVTTESSPDETLPVAVAPDSQINLNTPPESAPAVSGQEPLFEPYHTIDYFASQGIGLKQSDLEQDQFGRQLKSFTDWLKIMKRIGQPHTASSPPAPSQQEAQIEKTAFHSFASVDVETEAMAEVWLKQGNRQKAIDIYHKLSLHNPSKSHYFADKIEALKHK